MANLKEIRNRISSVSSTMQITSAMKMVSAAKLKKAQDAIIAMRPYANKLTALLQNLSANLDAESGSKFAESRSKQYLLLPLLPIGLCGAFNSNIIRQTNQLAEIYSDKKVSVVAIGKKGNDVLSKNLEILSNQSTVFDKLSFQNVAKIANMLMAKFESGAFDKIELVYNKFKNAATQIVTTEQFLPILATADERGVPSDYILGHQGRIVKTLIPKSLKMQLYKAIEIVLRVNTGPE